MFTTVGNSFAESSANESGVPRAAAGITDPAQANESAIHSAASRILLCPKVLVDTILNAPPAEKEVSAIALQTPRRCHCQTRSRRICATLLQIQPYWYITQPKQRSGLPLMSATQAPHAVAPPCRSDPENGANAAAEIGADLDKVIALFRKALPGCGLKLLVPPPLPDGKAGRVSVSTWRRGERSAPVHSGATARDTMMQVFDSEDRVRRAERRRAGCPLCRGRGWYIAASGVRAICTHPPLTGAG
jgi:hypothetical protein